MATGQTPYPPSYEQSQAALLQPALGPRYEDTPPPSTNPDYKSKEIDNASAPSMYLENFGQNSGYPGQNPGYPAQNPGYPAQNSGYPAQNSRKPLHVPGFVVPEPPKTTVTTAISAPVTVGTMGPYPCAVICPRCLTTVTSKVKKDPSILAWVACVVLTTFGCFCGCCLIPFCIDGCQNVEHFCPNCKVYFGRYSACH